MASIGNATRIAVSPSGFASGSIPSGTNLNVLTLGASQSAEVTLSVKKTSGAGNWAIRINGVDWYNSNASSGYFNQTVTRTAGIAHGKHGDYGYPPLPAGSDPSFDNGVISLQNAVTFKLKLGSGQTLTVGTNSGVTADYVMFGVVNENT